MYPDEYGTSDILEYRYAVLQGFKFQMFENENRIHCKICCSNATKQQIRMRFAVPNVEKHKMSSKIPRKALAIQARKKRSKAKPRLKHEDKKRPFSVDSVELFTNSVDADHVYDEESY
ncbi:hypothetical protein RRG08_065574 [Elysia crispata]|uniref:Uncharacterized protein n=1 Tax=Elysia crispata TaxID=231223 RepID=A0AAE0YNU1_9GAST|nr:hypothetical protein RRG08_065574 [Elysia crispata]